MILSRGRYVELYNHESSLSWAYLHKSVPSLHQLYWIHFWSRCLSVVVPPSEGEWQLREFIQAHQKTEQDMSALEIHSLIQIFLENLADFDGDPLLENVMNRLSASQLKSLIRLHQRDLASADDDRIQSAINQLTFLVHYHSTRINRPTRIALICSIQQPQDYREFIGQLIPCAEIQQMIKERADLPLENQIYHQQLWGSETLNLLLNHPATVQKNVRLANYFKTLPIPQYAQIFQRWMLVGVRPDEFFLLLPADKHILIVNELLTQFSPASHHEAAKNGLAQIFYGNALVANFTPNLFYQRVATCYEQREITFKTPQEVHEVVANWPSSHSSLHFSPQILSAVITQSIENVRERLQKQIAPFAVLGGQYAKFHVDWIRFLNDAWINRHRSEVEELAALRIPLETLATHDDSLSQSVAWLSALRELYQIKLADSQPRLSWLYSHAISKVAPLVCPSHHKPTHDPVDATHLTPSVSQGGCSV